MEEKGTKTGNSSMHSGNSADFCTLFVACFLYKQSVETVFRNSIVSFHVIRRESCQMITPTWVLTVWKRHSEQDPLAR